MRKIRQEKFKNRNANPRNVKKNSIRILLNKVYSSTFSTSLPSLWKSTRISWAFDDHWQEAGKHSQSLEYICPNHSFESTLKGICNYLFRCVNGIHEVPLCISEKIICFFDMLSFPVFKTRTLQASFNIFLSEYFWLRSIEIFKYRFQNTRTCAHQKQAHAMDYFNKWLIGHMRSIWFYSLINVVLTIWHWTQLGNNWSFAKI